MKGRYAVSAAGRGKGRVYAITEVIDGEYVLIADGLHRNQRSPKRKKLKHLRLLPVHAELPCTDEELAAQIANVNLSYFKGRDYSAKG